MRQILALIMSLMLIAGCTSNLFKPNQFSFTTAEMQKNLDKKFPIEKKYLGIIDLTLLNPKIATRPDTRRLALQFDTRVYMLGYNRVLDSSISITTSLFYDVAKQSVILKEPRLEKIGVVGMPSGQAESLNQIAAMLVSEQLEGASIYHFTENETRILGMSLAPESLEITDAGVTVHIQK
ncbi:DUF1439 domain-containing protein [Sulfuriferula nivalis]|uniref:DUF1439 domain-containing protein n=1 Tax=Sulfuriferula nivalis TaxID=2675298 RepID=A0A809RGV4_9PROT|nr:DUF1439 domain-containing protein [Sulfuriferula nivalis]BBP01109.1 hypothetical protein SFSGTM_18170 [Sulfuriferula nivalis]